MIAAFNFSKSKLSRLRHDKRGVAAIEFALVFPVLLLIYFGIVGVTQILSVDRKVTNIASSTADLVSQETVLDSTIMQDIYTASISLIAPFSTNSISIVVTSIEADENNITTVAWSNAHNGTAKSPGSSIIVPNGITQANTTVIFTEVSYNYVSVIGQLVASFFPSHTLSQTLSGTITLADKFYARPRNTNAVEFN